MDKALFEPYHEARRLPTICERANISPSGAGAWHAPPGRSIHHPPGPTARTMMTRWPSLVLFVAATVLVLGLPNGAAQAQTTTASITGRILDENEQPLPGVNVVAIHQPTGTRYGVATAQNGTFTIQGMRVGGAYTVTASFVGYQTVRRTGISLQLDETREINFQLQPKTTEMEEVEVIGQRSESATISKGHTGARTNVSAEEIEELPTIQRSLGDFARLIPQFTGTDGNNIAGRNQRYNSVQVDGATLNDVFGLQGSGGVPGGQAGTQPVSLDAIEEFNVEISPYDVQQSGFTGGRINAITKSGSNEFEGSLRYLGRNQNLIGDLNGEEFGTDFGEQYFVGILGGPIIKDELFFFVNVELFRRGEPEDTRVGTDPGAQNVFPAGQSTMERIRNIAQNQYDYNTGGFSPLTQRQDNQKVLAKLDWNLLDNHRLTLRHNFVDAYNETGLTRFNGGFDFAKSQYRFESQQNSTSLELSSRFGNSWFNEFRFVYTRIRDNRDPEGELFPAVNIQLENAGTVGLGVGGIEQSNQLNQDLFEISNNLTHNLGDHTIEVGTQNEIYMFDNLFIPSSVGTYRFSSFEVGDSTVTAIEAFKRGQPTGILDAAAYEHTYANPEEHGDNFQPRAQFTGMQFGGYAQDKWDVTEQLRLTLGLRVDVPYLPEDPSENPAVEEAFGFSTAEVPETQFLWSPRFGFNYSENLLGDDIETQIRGGTGIFTGRTPFVWLSNQYSRTGIDFRQVDTDISADAYTDDSGTYDRDASCFVGTSNPEEAPKPPEAGDLPGAGTCGGILGVEETSRIALTDPDFKYPQQFRASVGIDQELPFWNLVATIQGQYSSTINGVSARNLNIESPESGLQESAYGRPLYGPEQSIGGGFGGANRVSDDFDSVILLENANRGYEYFLTAELSREVARGLNWTVAYNFNRAKSIFNGSFDTARSLWQQNFAVDPNDPDLGTAEFEGRHRVLVTGNYQFSWGDRFSTTIGAFFETRSGQPITWIYGSNSANFGTDANADGFPFNDLPYVPENEREVVVASGNWELMDDFISSNEALDDARGGFVDRYADTAPWRTIFDLKLTQRIETVDGQRLELIANLENVLNLLNDEWGRIRFTPFNNQFAWGLSGYVRPDDVGSRMGGRLITQDDIGKPIVNFEEDLVRDKLGNRLYSTSSTASRWQLQLGVRYVF